MIDDQLDPFSRLDMTIKQELLDKRHKLFCFVELKDDEINYIQQHTKAIVNQFLRYGRNPTLTAYLMMLFSRDNYKEGGYWNEFWVSAGMERNPTKETVLGNNFREVCRVNGMHYTESSVKSNVVNFSMHAMIVKSKSNDFFNLMNRFYRIILDQSLGDDAKETVTKLLTHIAENQAGYTMFLLGTYEAFKKPDTCLKFIIKVLRRIDGSGDRLSDNLGIHETAFEEWSTGASAHNSSSNPYLFYDVYNDIVKIVIPERNVPLNSDGIIDVIRNDKVVSNINLKLTSLANYKISNQEIRSFNELKLNPFDDIELTIKGKPIFKLKGHDHIFFSSKGEQSRRINRGMNYVFIKKGSTTQFPDYHALLTEEEMPYEIHQVTVSPGQNIVINKIEYGVERKIDDIISLSDDNSDITCLDSEDHRIKVYNKPPQLFINIPTSKLSKTVVKIFADHDWSRILSDIPTSLCSRTIEGDNSIIKIDLSNIINNEYNGLCSIQINSRKKVLFILARELVAVLDKQTYRHPCISSVNIFTGSGIITKEFNSNDETIDITDIFPVPNYRAFIPIPAIYYSLNGKEWNISGSKISIDDIINETIMLKGPSIDDSYYTIQLPNSKKVRILNDENGNHYIESKKLTMFGNIPNFEYNKVNVMMTIVNDYSGRKEEFCLFELKIRNDYQIYPTSVIIPQQDDNITVKVKVSDMKEVPIANDGSITLPFSTDRTISIYEIKDDGFGSIVGDKEPVLTKSFKLQLEDNNFESEYDNSVRCSYGSYKIPHFNKNTFQTAINPLYDDGDTECKLNGFLFQQRTLSQNDLCIMYSEIWTMIFNEVCKNRGYGRHDIIAAVQKYKEIDRLRAYLMCRWYLRKYEDKDVKNFLYPFLKEKCSDILTELPD